jgi:hypothetical protein
VCSGNSSGWAFAGTESSLLASRSLLFSCLIFYNKFIY